MLRVPQRQTRTQPHILLRHSQRAQVPSASQKRRDFSADMAGAAIGPTAAAGNSDSHDTPSHDR